MGKIQDVIEKLERYAINDEPSSNLRMEDLRQAYQEYISWNTNRIDELKKVDPLHQMMQDFVLVPMSMLDKRTKMHEMRDQQINDEEYIVRLENTYKKFRPLYFDGVTLNRARSCRLESAYRSLLGFYGHGYRPLSRKLLKAGAFQYKTHLRRLESIRSNRDIFCHLNELEQLLSELNVKCVKVFGTMIIPKINEIKNSTEDLGRMSELFKLEMRKYGLVMISGGMGLDGISWTQLNEVF